MKTKRFTTEQIIGILKDADNGMPIKELCRKHGMSDVAVYNWKARMGESALGDGLHERQSGCSTYWKCLPRRA